MLRYISTGLLAFSFMLSSTELHQLLRIPFLLSHYQQHRRNDNSMSIWDFLQLHYTDVHPDDNDEQEDDGLPFKSSASINHLDQPWPHVPSILTRPYPIALERHIVCYAEGHPCDKVYGIFHPPRMMQDHFSYKTCSIIDKLQ